MRSCCEDMAQRPGILRKVRKIRRSVSLSVGLKRLCMRKKWSHWQRIRENLAVMKDRSTDYTT